MDKSEKSRTDELTCVIYGGPIISQNCFKSQTDWAVVCFSIELQPPSPI